MKSFEPSYSSRGGQPSGHIGTSEQEIPPTLPGGGFSEQENILLSDTSDGDHSEKNTKEILSGLLRESESKDFSFENHLLRKIGADKTIGLLEAAFSSKQITPNEKASIIRLLSDDIIFEEGMPSPDYFRFFDAVIDKINLRDAAAQDKTRNLLEILRLLLYTIYDYDEEASYFDKKGAFIEKLESLADKKDNYYFSNLRLSQILKTDLDFDKEGRPSTDKDVFPFRISPRQFGSFKDDTLLVTDKDDYAEASPYFEKIDTYRKYKEAEFGYIRKAYGAIDDYFESLHIKRTPRPDWWPKYDSMDASVAGIPSKQYHFGSLPAEKTPKPDWARNPADSPNNITAIQEKSYLDWYNFVKIQDKTADTESIMAKGTVFEDLEEAQRQKNLIRHMLETYPEIKNEIHQKIYATENAYAQAKNDLVKKLGLENARPDDDTKFNISDLEEKMTRFFHVIDEKEIILARSANPIGHTAQLADYVYLLSKPIRSLTEKEFGLEIGGLSLPEQSYFLHFLTDKTVAEVDQVKNFLNKSEGYDAKTNRIKAFLSLEHGGKDLGDKILSIGERFDQAAADAIFAKYAELADQAQTAAEYLASEFGVDDPQITQQVAEHLLKRGKMLLVLAADEKDLSAEEILAKIESIRTEVELFRESFHLAKTSVENFSLENVRAAQFKINSGPELMRQKEAVDQMKEIYLENYAGFPEEFRQKIIESLEKRLSDEKARFYSVFHNGKIAAFCSFLPQEDGTLHFANFNVDPDYQHSKLGEAMMEASLDQEAEKAPIIAEAVPGLKITDTYVSKKGFQKIGEVETAGVKLWQIRKEKAA